MTIEAITHALAAIAPLGEAEPAQPSQSAQQRFAELLNNPKAADEPGALFAAQSAFNELAVGTELTAKVAGSLTQSINKLVNMQ
ncbi:EscI/YscI/HrpB family type III secretion system inner rod protein [Chromobacterium sinusclupearum]|uniref:EscI/YscI/HrpB family type III secretion system inner rod protein n=1 Tax=Chromobacterium sinusclupearum TaxID=2077146 RepID=A0A2K4MS43_9NEIS|nr:MULTISPECIES: type III secretion system inner rod subunit SctI [Chromobacterium]OHX11797.1 EscI/YscI/HrpB family type III secretion system inner rod protein [Chromobacterium amazonense]POA99799.1 EscI/YscI/HrpB family type III secretion system inner rod protein [Chromobacterium sinusclupearum]